MPEEPTTIRASSRRQAMDWSLVLASQAIENVIECGPDETTWMLRVEPGDYPRAIEAVQLYQEENRHWVWRKQIVGGGLLFDWTSLLWVLLLCLFYWAEVDHPAMKDFGLMDSAAVAKGQVWRLFTAMWLHADLGHLASNCSLGIVLLGLAMGRYGSGVGLFAAYFAGLGGNVVVFLLSFGHPSLGASGMVMGCLGLMAASTFRWDRHRSPAFRYVARGVFAGVLLFVLMGLSPETDFRAHIGGFFSGLVVGGVLNRKPRLIRKQSVNLAAAVIFAVLVILPWGMVFRMVPENPNRGVENRLKT